MGGRINRICDSLVTDNVLLQAEIDEEERQRIAKFAHRLQSEERKMYSEGEKARLLAELINERKRYFAAQRAEERRNQPLIQAQQRTYMRVHTFVPMKSESERVIPELAAGSSKRDAEEELVQESSKRLKTRESSVPPEEPKDKEEEELEDLVKLWILVKEKFTSTKPTEDNERELSVELKRLFEPDTNDELWKLQKHIHDVTWRLYDTCGVDHVSTKDGVDIYMLVEKEYPLSRGVLRQMLVVKLLVEQDSKMSRELLRKIFMQVKIDNPNITMEEYIRLEEEKARRHGKVYNWETATYGKIWDNEDVYDLGYVEIEFPAIVFNDTLTSEAALSCEPTVSSVNDEINFRISFDESDDEDYPILFDTNSFSYKMISVNNLKTDSKNDHDKVNVPLLPLLEPTVSYFDDLDFFKDFENEFPSIVYNDAQMSKSDLLTEPILNPQRIDEFNLKDETSLSECDEEEQNVLNFNDLFPFNVIYPDELKTDTDNDNDKFDIEHSSGDLSVKPLPDVINTDDGAYAHGSNKLLETMKLKNEEITEGIIQNYYDGEDGETTPRFEFSLLLTPLCCDDTHDVTPRVSALAGCDRLVSEPLVIENFILTYDYSISEDPKEEQIQEEPLEELREKG
ncbi:hypothetical protein Tco_1002668 [Tanacetum coccineum]|uniref:Uncharacterized protein n=1 Tax=Tanacetum coccineum TaxID=301880 RepID=A0ABQ5F781_9ASTR